MISTGFQSINMIEVVDQLAGYDPVDSELMSIQLSTVLSMHSMIEESNDEQFQSIHVTNTKRQDSISPEELSKCECIGLKTADRTLKAITNQHIRTTCILSKRFRTDKAHIRYK